MIPKVVHFVWVGPSLPDYAKVNMERFRHLNPDFQFRLHGEEILLSSMRSIYEHIEGDHEYARKSDLLRISALIRGGGGWYFDCDFVPIRPLSDLYQDYNNFPQECFLTHCDHYADGTQVIANGIIGATKTHQILRLAFGQVFRRYAAATINGGSLGWDTFGPRMFQWIVLNFSELCPIGEIDKFYPIRPHCCSRKVYNRLQSVNFADWALDYEFPQHPKPYMMHMGMMDDLNP